MPSVVVPSSHKQSWSGIICTYQDFCIFIDQKKTTSALHLDTTFHWWPLNFLTHFSMHKKSTYAHKMAVLLFFCRPLGLITDYKVLHPKATRFRPGQVSTDWKLSSLGCAVACMKWLWSQSSSPWISMCITNPISISSDWQICWQTEPFYHFTVTNHCFRSSLVAWLCDPLQSPCRTISGDKQHRYSALLEQHPS